MSTPIATPPQAKANSRVVGNRHTVASVVDDIKIDAAGWQVPPQGEWTTVRRHITNERAKPPIPAIENTPPVKKVWRETAKSRAQRVETRRRQSFLDSLMYGRGWATPAHRLENPKLVDGNEPSTPTGFGHAFREPTGYDSEPDVVTPSQTKLQVRILTPIEVVKKRSDVSRRRSLKKRCVQLSAGSVPRPLPDVSKEEAARPVVKAHSNPKDQGSLVTPNPFQPLTERDAEERGPGYVTCHSSRGTTFVDSSANRTMTVKMRTYNIVKSGFLGIARKYVSESALQPIIGVLHNTDEEFSVHLPVTCVSELGSWWINRVPSVDNYTCFVEFARRWCKRIDFATPEMEEDVLIYGTYLAFITRINERADVTRRSRGLVFTRTAKKCLAIGALTCASSAMPMAMAASALTSGGIAMHVATPIAVAATALATVVCAAAIKCALPWFAHDLAHVVKSEPIASTNPTCGVPPPIAGSRLVVCDPPKAHDQIKAIAAYPTGVCLAGYEPTVLSTNQDAVVTALGVRCLAEPAVGCRKDFIAWTDKYWEVVIARVFDLHIPQDVKEQDDIVQDWIDTSGSSPSVKARVALEWAAFRADGYHMHTPLPAQLAWELTKRDVSVKNETILKDDSAKPRQILACSPQFVAIIAPFVKRLTGLIKKKLASGSLIFAPGLNESEISRLVSEREWDNRANGDFNSYDSNQGPDMGDSEIRKFTRYGLPVAGRQLMRAGLVVHGGSRTGVKFTSPYKRNSGDPHTTLMNTVWNLLAQAYVYCRARDCHPKEMDVLFIAGGDDFQLNYNGTRIDFEAGLASLGLPATVKHVDHLNQVEFLSCRLTRTSRGWRFIPMVGRMFTKLSFSVRANPHNCLQILRGAALGFEASFAASPPGAAIIATYLRLTQGVEPITTRAETWKMKHSHTGQATAETWDDLFSQYGWTRELQSCLERDLSSITEAGVTVHSASLEVLVDRDSLRKICLEPKPSDSDQSDSHVDYFVALPNRNQVVVQAPPISSVETIVKLAFIKYKVAATNLDNFRFMAAGRPIEATSVCETRSLEVVPKLIGGITLVDVRTPQPVDDCFFVDHLISLPGVRPVVVRALPMCPVIELVQIAFARTGANWSASNFRYACNGRPINLTDSAFGISIEVIPKMLGGSSVSLFAGIVSKIPALLHQAMSRLPPVVTEATVEAAVSEAWDQWFLLEESKCSDTIIEVPKTQANLTVKTPRQIMVELSGHRKTVDITGDFSYADVFAISHGVPLSVLPRLMPKRGSRVVEWRDNCEGDFDVFVRGHGGSNSNVTTGNRIMDQICGELGITPQGKAAITAIADPFHDTPLPDYCGFPDNDESPALQQVVQSTYIVTVPSGIEGNWDCHFANLPWINANSSGTLTETSYGTGFFNFQSGGSSGTQLSGLMYDAVASGTITYQAGSSTPTNLDHADTAPYTIENWRQVATGFKVINTTSELYKQGAVTVYRSPFPTRSSKSTTCFYNIATSGAGAVNVGWADAVEAQAPPATIAQAIKLVGSKQWEAKEGCYVVSTTNSTDMAVGNDNTAVILEFAASTRSAIGLTLSGQQPIPTGGWQFTAVYAAGMGLTDFNLSGAYFTGLSNQTTLQVSLMRYYERFPSATVDSDQALVVLAKPSCRFDPTALEAYSAMLRHMPTGVPARMNGLGDWFREAAETVRDIVSPVLSAIPLPMAQMGASILNGVGKNLVSKYTPPGAPVAIARQLNNTIQEEKREERALTRAVRGGQPRARPNRASTRDVRSFQATAPGAAWVPNAGPATLLPSSGGTTVRVGTTMRRRRKPKRTATQPVVYNYS